MKWPEVFGYYSLNVARYRFNRAPQTDSDIIPSVSNQEFTG
jgi:hypothetical protein